MRDLNFFEPYIEKRRIQFSKSMALYSLVGLICLGMVVFGIFNGIKSMGLKSEVSELQAVAEDPAIVDKVLYVQEKEAEMNLFKTEVENIQYMDKVIEAKEIVSEELIRNITYNLPKDTYLTSITIYQDSISLLGISNDKWSIAEFGRSLESIEGLNEVYISSISTVEDRFSFNLDISLEEEEDTNGEDEIEETKDQVAN